MSLAAPPLLSGANRVRAVRPRGCRRPAERALRPRFEPRLVLRPTLHEESAGSGDAFEPKRTTAPRRGDEIPTRLEWWPCVATNLATSSISDEPAPRRVCHNPHMHTMLIAAAFFTGPSGIVKAPRPDAPIPGLTFSEGSSHAKEGRSQASTISRSLR